MNKITATLFSVCVMLAAGSAVAQEQKKDGMAKEGMAKDAMSKDCTDAMSKGAMSKDAMAKDAMAPRTPCPKTGWQEKMAAAHNSHGQGLPRCDGQGRNEAGRDGQGCDEEIASRASSAAG